MATQPPNPAMPASQSPVSGEGLGPAPRGVACGRLLGPGGNLCRQAGETAWLGDRRRLRQRVGPPVSGTPA